MEEKRDKDNLWIELGSINQNASVVFDLIKKSLSIGTILAFLSLVLYVKQHNIPLPISLSSLPTLLLAIFGISFFIVVYMSLFLIVPTFYREEKSWLIMFENRKQLPEEPSFWQKINIKRHRNRSGFWVYLATIVIPVVFYAIALSNKSYWVYVVLIVHLLIVLFLSLEEEMNGQNVLEAILNFMLVFLSVFWLVSIAYVILRALNEFGISNSTSSTIQIVIISFMFIALLVILYFFTVPGENRERKSFKDYLKVTAIISAFLWMLLLNPQFFKFSYAGFAMNAMNIGGGKAVTVLMLNNPSKDNLFPELIDESSTRQSVNLLVMLDVGNHLYVKIQDNPDCGTYEIPKSIISSRKLNAASKENKKPKSIKCEKFSEKLNELKQEENISKQNPKIE